MVKKDSTRMLKSKLRDLIGVINDGGLTDLGSRELKGSAFDPVLSMKHQGSVSKTLYSMLLI